MFLGVTGSDTGPDGGERIVRRARGSVAGAVVASITLALVWVVTASAQTRTVGLVVDAETRDPLSGAIVALPELGIRVISDESGRIDLGRLARGEYHLTAERVGYAMIREGDLPVPSDEDLVILLDRSRRFESRTPGRIVGRVTEEGEGRGISDVEVTVVSPVHMVAVTDQAGRFDLRDLQPGLMEVQFTHLSYAPRTTTLIVQPGGTVEIAAAMSTQPIEIGPIEVTVRSRWLAQSGFYQRMEGAAYHGRQFTRADINAIQPVLASDIVRRVAGLSTDFDPLEPDRVYAVQRRGMNRCVLPVFVDGRQEPENDLNRIPFEWIAGMEVYLGVSTPPQFLAPGRTGLPCGAVLIWTTRER